MLSSSCCVVAVQEGGARGVRVDTATRAAVHALPRAAAQSITVVSRLQSHHCLRDVIPGRLDALFVSRDDSHCTM